MKKYLSLLALTTLLVGCGPPVVQKETDVQVGVVNGRTLRRVTVSGDGNAHYIYYFPSDRRQPISSNMRIGKTGTVVVMIDGQPVSTNHISFEE